MNWIQLYRLDCELKKEISDFISYCEEGYENHSTSQKVQIKREKRLSHFLDEKEQEVDRLEYLNRFLDDYSDKIRYLSLPVGQFMYTDDSDGALRIHTQNIAVSSYAFENYLEVKIWLDMMLLENKCYVFNYKIRPEPTLVSNKQRFNHVLRCFFVSEQDTKKWLNEYHKNKTSKHEL